MARVPELSIIIPVRNEQQTIASILRSLSRQDRISDCEVIVVDGGSTDDTRDVAVAFPFVEMISSPPGLSKQMNYGASNADGKALWFLHADATLPGNNTITHILAALESDIVAGGACRFRIRADDLYYRFISTLVNFRAKWLKRPYGDQGIFVRKHVFNQLGGYRDMPCADVDLYIRMGKHGETRLVRASVATSARTWHRYGKITTTGWHLKEWLTFEYRRKYGKLEDELEIIPPPCEPEAGSDAGAKGKEQTSAP